MIEKHLGNTIDIHGGGNDLIFPHHENEIAQSECSHNGKKLANFWMHNGYVTIDKEKMSKSLGNSITLNSLLKSYPGETIRFTLLSAHYRQPLDWSNKALKQAQKTLDRMYSSLSNHLSIPYQKEIPPDDTVIKALCDDLNTPKALSELSRLCKKLKSENDTNKISELKSKIISSGQLIGLLQESFSDLLRPSLDDQENQKIQLTFENNEIFECDHLIISDGIFSKSKNLISNNQIHPRYNNTLAIRGMLPNLSLIHI